MWMDCQHPKVLRLELGPEDRYLPNRSELCLSFLLLYFLYPSHFVNLRAG